MEYATMRWILSVFLILLLTAAAASAATKYVSDRLDITVRSGPGIQYRIIKNLPTGTRVQTLEQKEGWTRIKLSEERDGWVLNRYLSNDVPDSKKYKALKEQCEPLEKQMAELESANQTLKAENQALSEELSAVRQELSKTRQNFEQLKEKSADYLALKKEHEKLTQA
ncbi:MAG: TIGR04211 family SH3 domain-containing protein, partial [Thermodesulfobacteriota bacterium]